MTVSDKTIQTEGLGSFFENLGNVSAKAGKKIATIVLGNPARALEIDANVATEATSRKAALSTLPAAIKFYHEGRRLYLGKFIWFHTI